VKPVIVINQLVIKPDKMDEFIDAQRNFATALREKPCGLIGGRMYRSVDGKSAILLSQFESESALEDLRQSHAFKEHLNQLRVLVESANPSLYQEAYTTGDFK
jgi:quinol monooxygenase YgiN